MAYGVQWTVPDPTTIEVINIGRRAAAGKRTVYLMGKNHRWNLAQFPEQAERWKTEEGALKNLGRFCQNEWNSYQYRKKKPGYYRNESEYTEEQFFNQFKVVELKELPPPKFAKKKMTGKESNELRIQIAKAMIAKGWKPNVEFAKTHLYKDTLDELGFPKQAKYWGGLLIDAEGRFAVTLKAQVMTIHDATRQFCKVVSMSYNEIEITKNEIICGKIALKL